MMGCEWQVNMDSEVFHRIVVEQDPGARFPHVLPLNQPGLKVQSQDEQIGQLWKLGAGNPCKLYSKVQRAFNLHPVN